MQRLTSKHPDQLGWVFTAFGTVFTATAGVSWLTLLR
jgi:hypothetical protein